MAYDVTDVGRLCVRNIAQLDHVANNIANATTPGFKTEHLHYFISQTPKPGSDLPPEHSPQLAIDHSQGAIQKTGNPLDVAIHGDGFFAVQAKGNIVYTRKGDFTVTSDGKLVTTSGEEVLGDGGALVITGSKVRINDQGVVEVDGAEIGRLRVVTFDNKKALVRQGAGLFRDPGAAGLKTVEEPVILSGHLEVSNVQAVKEMIGMVDLQRSFETYQKIILTMQDMDKLSTSRVGRLA
ncbi:MAG: Flagellar basal-body rod protein FlgG [Syntrophus sp. SKADARSKE-3]|nr:Flagellar basal-body rod protein FlgG [Syntrophus sp. SKADARSKE-3]